MRLGLKTLTLALVVTLMAVPAAFAKGPGGEGGPPPWAGGGNGNGGPPPWAGNGRGNGGPPPWAGKGKEDGAGAEDKKDEAEGAGGPPGEFRPAEAAESPEEICAAQRSSDPAAFQEAYGENWNKDNAFGMCVSSEGRNLAVEQEREGEEEEEEELEANLLDGLNPAQFCFAKSVELGDEFATTYGTNVNLANAFGKCVSQRSEELESESETGDEEAGSTEGEDADEDADATDPAEEEDSEEGEDENRDEEDGGDEDEDGAEDAGALDLSRIYAFLSL